MNITKFGAFVNILPGRDGLLHISKIGGGKRIDRVEDVLDLGDEIEVRVDDVDPQRQGLAEPGQRRSAAAAAAAAIRATAAIVQLAAAPAARAAVGTSSGRRPRCPSRTPSTPRCARSSAISVRPRRAATVATAVTRWPWSVAAAAAVAAGAVATVAVEDLSEPDVRADRPGQRHPRRHRADARGPVGHDRLLGRRRRPRRARAAARARRTSSSTCCSRAPRTAAHATSPSPSTRSAAR